MRSLFCVSAVLVVALTATSAAIAAPNQQESASSAWRTPGLAAVSQRSGDSPVVSISGRVLDFSGQPVAGAEVAWGWWTSFAGYHYGASNLETDASGTDSSGSFSLGGVGGGHLLSGAPADDLHAWYFPKVPGLEAVEIWDLDFAQANDALDPAASYVMQPARANMRLKNAPGRTVEVVAGNPDIGYAGADVPLVGGAGVASVLPMSNFDDLVAFFYHDEAHYRTCQAVAEWLGSPVAVAAGQVATATIALDWRDAQYAYLADPDCQHSGKPGSVVSMTLRNWPRGERATFVGYSSAGAAHTYARTITSPGRGRTASVPLRIAAGTPVGVYEIDTYRAGGTHSLVRMWDDFQVCTFHGSAPAVRRGQAVRLSGKVPARGRVTLYARAGTFGQPTTLAAKGWHKLASYSLTNGSFSTGRVFPTHTTSYVVRYSGDAFPAFTSVVRVVVR